MSVQGEWARCLLDGLARAGVTNVVISPGSRSTPFVVAAARHPSLVVHDVIDERSAAFFALGQARATGRPTLLLCTSGSAVAHYLPAVVEASASFLPLLVLSADRPPELHDCGANQTVPQRDVFGRFARHSVDLGAPDGTRASLRALRRIASQMVARALGPEPGPAHLNAPLRKPLDPDAEDLARPASSDAPQTSFFPATRGPSAAGVTLVREAIASARRLLVVAGPFRPDEPTKRAFAAFVERTDALVLAETTSGLRSAVPRERRIDAIDAIYRSAAARKAFAPDVVIQIGATPTAKGYELLLEEGAIPRRIVLADHGWPDPTSDAEAIVEGPIGAIFDATTEPPSVSPDTRFVDALRTLDRAARSASGDALDAAGDRLSEGAVAREVLAGMPAGGALVVGNSLAVREIDAWAPESFARIDVFSQRGASGIDGLVAGAAGVASVRKTPTVLLLGDVAFAHDVSSLALAKDRSAPFVAVVVDNGGGRIFEQLPIAKAAPSFLPHFLTPPAIDFESAARAFGLRHEQADRVSAFRDALARSLAHGEATVLHAKVPASGACEQNERVWHAVDAAAKKLAGGA